MENAFYRTGYTALTLPIGFVILVLCPKLELLAISLMVVGLVSLVVGWVLLFMEQNQRIKEIEVRYAKNKME